jgi:hypothetical protein
MTMAAKVPLAYANVSFATVLISLPNDYQLHLQIHWYILQVPQGIILLRIHHCEQAVKWHTASTVLVHLHCYCLCIFISAVNITKAAATEFCACVCIEQCISLHHLPSGILYQCVRIRGTSFYIQLNLFLSTPSTEINLLKPSGNFTYRQV